MRFRGPVIPVDDEGSIVFDGEKFIFTNPSKVPENFNSGGRPVVGLPEDYLSRPNNHQPSLDTPPSGNPIFNKEKAIEHVERTRQEREAARNKQSRPSDPVVPEDLPAETKPDIDMFDFLSLASGEEPAETDVWHENSRLTQGQAQHVDHLLTVETDSLAREVLITLKRDGIPPRREWNDFMAQYALFSWDSEADAQAWATLATIANSDWDEATAYADEDHVEAVAQDRANDWIEGLTIIHAGTGDILLDVTGVERADGSQYVGLQDTEVEALKGLPLIFVHNHRDTDASNADLISAFDAGAKLLMVITRHGQEYVYIRGRDRMVKVRDGKASYEIRPGTLDEALWLQAESQAQARKYLDDPPEFVFLQSDPEVLANLDVNPNEIARYGELQGFVIEGLDELQETGEKELISKIFESMALLEDIFGYNIEFCGGNSCDEEFNIESLTVEERRLAMRQVHNLATILFHFLNDLGIKIMQSTPGETNYILWADERIRDLHNVADYAYRGHVFMPESLGEEDISELQKVYLGSEIVQGAIAHEVSHEIDRRAGDLSSVSEAGEPPPVGSLEWFLKHRVENRINRKVNEYDFAQAATYLNPGSRAARKEDLNSDREIFADILPAKILGPMEEEYFPRADTDAAIGFNATNNAKDTACGIEQYYDQLREYLEGVSKRPPKDFIYDPDLCE